MIVLCSLMMDHSTVTTFGYMFVNQVIIYYFLFMSFQNIVQLSVVN